MSTAPGMASATVAPESNVALGYAAPDFSQLLAAPEFLIAQTRKGCFQEWCGCDANSQFKFIVQGQHVAMLDEKSSCLVRFCCGGNRWWKTRMVMSTNTDSSFNEQLPAILNFDRPFRCRSQPCKCCCFQEVITTDGSGNILGGIKEQSWCCVPKFSVYGADMVNKYEIHQPTCCCGTCVHCCSEGCCNCRIPFYLYPPGGDDSSTLLATYSTCAEGVPPPAKAQICKIWSGLAREVLFQVDTFELKTPDFADHNDKANLIAATLMINQLFFERAGEKEV